MRSVEVFAAFDPALVFAGQRAQLVVGTTFHLRLEPGDRGHHRLDDLELLAFAGGEDALEQAHAARKGAISVLQSALKAKEEDV